MSWIVDYLMGRPQYVRLQNSVSDGVFSNTGGPQGTVFSSPSSPQTSAVALNPATFRSFLTIQQ